MILRATVVMFALVITARGARADGRLDDTFAVHETGAVLIDGGLITGIPAALGTGLSTGFAAGITHTCGCNLAYGARASWSMATESSSGSSDSNAFTVTHQDVRLRAIGELRHAAGRGTFGLRLGAGATVVHESRSRTQMRPGLDELASHATDTLPAADLEAVVDLQITGQWVMVVQGGPSIDYFQNSLHGGWVAGLGVGWQL